MKKNTYFTILRIVALIGALAVIVLLLFSSLGQKTAYDNNILFVVDLSYSMNAKDITSVEGWRLKVEGKISRLDAAKEIIKQIVEVWGEANYGLVIFSQSATQYVPLTADTWTFMDYIKDVNTGLLPGGGTDWNSLQKIFSGDKTSYAKIIFISDAEALASSTKYLVPGTKSLATAKKYFIGVGTEEGGNPTLPNGTIMKMNWKNIITSFDVQTATTISKVLNAKLFQVENVNNMDSVIGQIVSSSRTFSHSEVQLLVVVLWVFILLVL